MPDLKKMLETSQGSLNSAYEMYLKETAPEAKEFDHIKLQTCIFQYELCKEMLFLTETSPTGFSHKVALKGAVHLMFEYMKASHSLLQRIKALAKARGITLNDSGLKEVKVENKPSLQRLLTWESTRNKATAHYDKDTAAQFALIEGIDQAEVMDAMKGLLLYNMELLKLLKVAGSRVNS